MSPLDTARALLESARRVAVLTGAGMSAESGVPTFRDALTGLWARFDPAQLATPAAFRADPALVWRWYAERRAGVLRAQPHAGHRALAAAAAHFERFALVTQNVDGLHARAGSPEVIELHGNILASRCFDECGLHIDDPAELPPGEPPRCPACGAWLRPGVVWFGEALDAAMLARAEREVAQAELVLVVGTSGLVYPAAGLLGLARAAGAKVVIVNPNPSDIDAAAHVIVAASAAHALPVLFAAH
ncbi:MAG: NAD-dependent deacylase [Burkholderiaceae bacterium]|nr:NAD-dependent deacylase [Burkholderiaceae bacterium]